jgi:hypothetical protein
MLTAGVAALVIVTVTALLVADSVVAQLALLVITTETTSLLIRVVVVNVAAVCPLTGLPFILHWNAGALPLLTGEAVKVTGDPEQEVTLVGVIDTDGVTTGLMTTVTALLVAVAVEVQVALLVNKTITTSLFESVVVVKVLAVAPVILTPFTCH